MKPSCSILKDIRTDRHEEDCSRFLRFCERASPRQRLKHADLRSDPASDYEESEQEENSNKSDIKNSRSDLAQVRTCNFIGIHYLELMFPAKFIIFNTCMSHFMCCVYKNFMYNKF
jgi:hypothetical protein